MPPNVKEVALALESLDLSSHVLSKYAPLTSELAAEEEQATAAAAASASAAHDDESSEQVVGLHHAAAPAKLQQQQQHYEHAQDVEKQQQQQREADSYWGMPHQPEPTEESRRQALIDDILREDEIRQMFTVDRIVANLVAEKGDERKEGVAQAAATAAADDADSYWDMPADEVEAEAAPIEAVDASIFSADHIVANLIASSQQQEQQAEQEAEEIITAPHVNDPSHPLHSYWDWDTSPQATSYEAKRLALVERIVQEEAARQLLSSDRIVANVVRSMAERSTAASTAATAATNTVTNTSSSKGSSDAYWSFAATTNTEDRILAPHINDPNHPLADYWTWDTSPKSDQEQRRVLVDWILREEAARLATCTDAVVDGLLKISSATNDATATACVVEESKESGEGYWDW